MKNYFSELADPALQLEAHAAYLERRSMRYRVWRDDEGNRIVQVKVTRVELDALDISDLEPLMHSNVKDVPQRLRLLADLLEKIGEAPSR